VTSSRKRSEAHAIARAIRRDRYRARALSGLRNVRGAPERFVGGALEGGALPGEAASQLWPASSPSREGAAGELGRQMEEPLRAPPRCQISPGAARRGWKILESAQKGVAASTAPSPAGIRRGSRDCYAIRCRGRAELCRAEHDTMWSERRDVAFAPPHGSYTSGTSCLALSLDYPRG